MSSRRPVSLDPLSIGHRFRRCLGACLPLAAWAVATALLVAPRPADAADAADTADTLESVVAEFQARGYPSPASALQRLQPLAPPADAVLERRWRYEAALSGLAVMNGEPALVREAMARLQRMVDHEACTPCASVLTIRRKQLARFDPVALRRSVDELTTQPEPQDPALRFEWVFGRATGHSNLGDHDRAIVDALKALEIATAHDRPADRIFALDVLGIESATRRDLDRALDYAQQGIALARQIGFRYALARLLLNKSYALSAQKETAERKDTLQELLQLTDAAPGLEAMRQSALINLAALSNARREYVQAVEYAVLAERASDREGDPNSLAFALLNRGAAWVRLGRTEEGLALVASAIHIAEKVGNKRELADLVEQQVGALEAAGRLRDALDALRRWTALSAEVTRSERDQVIAQLQEAHASRQRQQEIETLRLDNARREAQLQAHAWRERAWAGSAALVAVLAVVIWQRLARTRAANLGLRDDVARLSDESHHDALTGACNRRHGEDLLSRLGRNDARSGDSRRREVALILLDVDHFKRVNDTHGHAAGDAVLIELTRRLQTMLRDGDTVVRWGGEEFLLILPNADETVLKAIAKRALAAVGRQAFALPQGGPLAMRVSAGAVVWPCASGIPWSDRLALADAALYRAKAQGRNRAVFALGDAPVFEAELGGLDAMAARGVLRLSSLDGMAVAEPCVRAPGAVAADEGDAAAAAAGAATAR